MQVADTLPTFIEDGDSEEMDIAVHTFNVNLPVSEGRRADFVSATANDSSMQQVKKLTMEGRPSNINNVLGPAQAFWKVHDACGRWSHPCR